MAKSSYTVKKYKSSDNVLILLYFSFSGKRVRISTKESVNELYWNSDKQKIDYSKCSDNEEIKSLNFIQENLNSITEKAQIIYNNFKIKREREPSTSELKTEFERELFRSDIEELKNQNQETLFGYFDKFIEMKRNEDLHRTAVSSYKRAKDRLQEYAKKNLLNLDFVDIDLMFASTYKKYLLEDLKLAPQTVQREMKRIRTVLHSAYTENKHDNRLYQNEKFSYKPPQEYKLTLTEQEIKILYEYDLSHKPYLERVRDIFVLACHTSLRFSDVKRITTFHIQDNRIKIKEQKSSKSANAKDIDIDFFGYAEEILKKYKYDVKSIAISTPKTNVHLKEIFKTIPYFKEKPIEYEQVRKKKVEVIQTNYAQKINFHTSRRSFCTNRFIEGWDLSIIMDYTGHTREQTLLTYIKPTKEHQRQREQRIRKEIANRKPLLQVVK